MGATATLGPAARPSAATHCAKMGMPMADDATRSVDAHLAVRLREGDPEALRDAYSRFGRVTFGFLVKALGDRGAAEDVQQQVFTQVWQRAESYDPDRGSLLSWLMTIARSRAIDHRRRRVPEPLDPEVAATELDSRNAGEDERIDRLTEQWRMRELLDRLPEAEAEALRRRFYGELSQSEIAEREGIPLGTVKTRMFAGLRRLRDLIDEEGR